MTSEPAHNPATTLVQNRYQIIRQIGQGGMGAVYEAIDTRLGHQVAIKRTLAPAADQLPSQDRVRIERAFEREGRILAGVRHSALPVVCDYFTEEQSQYLVMQYIPGDDLNTLLQQRGQPFPYALVLEWAKQLLDVLDYLHSQDPAIIHRDIKPHNLKLTPQGELVLLDFGLARGEHALAQEQSNGSSLVAYTPQYAPMEQIRGQLIGPSSDIYALAATMYHLMTGQLPASAIDRAAAALEQRPDPLLPAHSHNPAIPVALSEVLLHAMAPRIEARLDSAALRAAFEQLTRPAQPAARPAIPQYQRPVQPPAPALTRQIILSQMQRASNRYGMRLQQAIPYYRSQALTRFQRIKTRLLPMLQCVITWFAQHSSIAAGSTIVAILLCMALLVSPRASATSSPIAGSIQVSHADESGYQRAIETLTAALAVQPDNPTTLMSRAEAYRATGNLEAARADYTRSLAINPSLAEAYLGRATIAMQLGQSADAIADLQQCLTLTRNAQLRAEAQWQMAQLQ